MYYLYNRFPLFVSKQNKGEIVEGISIKKEIFDVNHFSKLFKYCEDNYDFSNIILVFHPNSSDNIINFFETNGVQCIVLEQKSDKSWNRNLVDGHWSCFGHEEASKQITTKLKALNL